MNTDQLTPVVRRWLRHTEATPPDAHRSARQVVARMPYVRQRGRWWPLPTLGHRTSSAPSTSDREQRFVAIPDTTYRIPTVTGRTRLMFSPVRAIVAGALVFALGGAFLIAQPFGQQDGVPGAEQGAELAPPLVVTITESEGTGVEGEECIGEAPAVCTWGVSSQWSATDPRLSGTATRRATEYFWEDGGIYEAYAVEVVNDMGTWVGTGRAIVAREFGDLSMYTLSGEGEYEGLSAVLTPSEDGIFKAVIVEGGLPPFPELPAAE